MLQGIAAKSVAPITGDSGPIIVFCYAILALGLPASTMIPSAFTHIICPDAIVKERATTLLERRVKENPLQHNLSTNARNYLNTLHTMTIDEPPGNTAMATLEELLTLAPDDLLFTENTNDTVVERFAEFFPQLSEFLRTCDHQIVIMALRPIFAHLALKTLRLWRRVTTYTVALQNERVSSTLVNKIDRTVILSEVVSATESAMDLEGNMDNNCPALFDILRENIQEQSR